MLLLPALAHATDVRFIGPIDRTLTRPESAPATNFGVWNGGAEDGGDVVYDRLEFRLNGFRGIRYAECLPTQPHFHAQHIVRLPNKDGRAYFMVSNSNAFVPPDWPIDPAQPTGHISVYRTDADALDPVTDLVVNTPGEDGEIVWEAVLAPGSNIGAWNHPAKMSVLGNLVVVAAQDWDAPIGCPDGHNEGSEAAVLFFDVRDPANPIFWGKLTKSELGVPEVETVALVKSGPDYVLIVDNKWWHSGSITPDISSWKYGGITDNGSAISGTLQGDYFNSLELYPAPSTAPESVIQPGRERVAWSRGYYNGSGDEVFTFAHLNFAPPGDPAAISFTPQLGSTAPSNANRVNFAAPNLWNVSFFGIHEKDYDAGGISVVRGMPVVYSPAIYRRNEEGIPSADKIYQVYNPDNLDLQAPQPTPMVSTATDDVEGSLRYAMQYGGTIDFDPILNGATIRLNREDGPLAVGFRDDVIIDASNLPDGITISGDSNDDGFASNADTRVFQIELGKTVTMKNVNIERGWAPQGAGLLNVGGNVTLEDCVVRFNVTQGSAGLVGLTGDGGGILNGMLRRDNVNMALDGAIYLAQPCELGSQAPECLFSGGALTLKNCSVQNNVASGSGGGIANIGGQLNVINSTIANNTATLGGGIMNRGGVYATPYLLKVASVGSMVVENSTIAENTGGVFIDNAYEVCSELTEGGDFACTQENVSRLNHATVASNLLDPLGMSTTVGIINDPSVNSVAEETPSDLLIENSIVAYHTDGGVSANIRGTFASAGQPVMPDWPIAGTLLGGGAPPVTADPLLAPLGDYGGPTKTLRPTSTQGLLLFANNSRTLFPETDPSTPLLLDQRGSVRGDMGMSQIDVGAAEFLDPSFVLDIEAGFAFTNVQTPAAGTSLASSWFGQSEQYCPPTLCAADNNDAMQAPDPVAGEFPSLTADFMGDGIFSFWAKTTGGFVPTPDLLDVYVDDLLVESIYGNNGGWQRYTTLVAGGGIHTVEWEAIPGTNGQAWIDEVKLIPLPDPAVNDLYANRIAISEGQTETTLLAATNDGGSSQSQPGRPDIWYVVTAPGNGTMQINTCGSFALSGIDTVISLHLDNGVVGTSANEVAANDQWPGADPGALPCVDFSDSTLAVAMSAGETLVLRVSDFPDFGGNEIGTRSVLVNVIFESDAMDTDFDGITDDIDNCTFKANFDQFDSDGDNIGNLCDGDIAVPNNCVVNAVDLGVFKAAFFSTPAAPNWNPDADFTNDGVINAVDLGIFKSGFFSAPGPSAMGCN